MRFHVKLSSQAEFDVQQTYEYIRRNGPADPERWLSGLEEKLASLEEFADWKVFAPENEIARREICQLSYGPFRILYSIQDDDVYVLTVRHGSRRFMTAKQIDELSKSINETEQDQGDHEEANEP